MEYPDEIIAESDPLFRDMVTGTGVDARHELANRILELQARADRAGFLADNTVVSGMGADSTEHNGTSSSAELSQVGDYVLIRQIGRGGFGRVFEGYHRDRPERKVAVKVFEGRGLDAIERLEIEKLVLKKLDHPNLVTAVDEGLAEDSTNFLVMKLIEGVRIDQFAMEKQLGFRQIAELFREMAKAMEYAHQQDVVHRDLKPANILVTDNGVPVITDFGLAKRLNLEAGHSLTATGALIGTLGYLAPEQADLKRREVTRSVDVYGLGATLYHILTGRAPFSSDNLLKALDDLKNQPPEPPSEIRPNIPSDLEQVCLKCLAKSPADRYESMPALARDLQRFIDGRAVAARPPRWYQRTWRWCCDNPVLSGLVTSLAISLVSVTWLWTQASHHLEVSQQRTQDFVEMIEESTELVREAETDQTTLQLQARLLRAVTDWYEKLATTAPLDSPNLRAAGVAWFKLGRVENQIGDLVARKNAYERAETIFHELSQREPEVIRHRFDLYHALASLSRHEESLPIIESVVQDDPSRDQDYLDAYANALLLVAREKIRRLHDLELARRLIDRGESIAQQAAARFPDHAERQRKVAQYSFLRMELFMTEQNLDQAWELLKTAIRQYEQAFQIDDRADGICLDLIRALQVAASLALLDGDHVNAQSWLDQSHSISNHFLDEFPFHEAAWHCSWLPLQTQVLLDKEQEDLNRFATSLQACQEFLEKRLLEWPDDWSAKMNLALLLSDPTLYEEPELDRAWELMEQARALPSAHGRLYGRGLVALRCGRIDEALREFENYRLCHEVNLPARQEWPDNYSNFRTVCQRLLHGEPTDVSPLPVASREQLALWLLGDYSFYWVHVHRSLDRELAHVQKTLEVCNSNRK